MSAVHREQPDLTREEAAIALANVAGIARPADLAGYVLITIDAASDMPQIATDLPHAQRCAALASVLAVLLADALPEVQS